MPIWIALVLGIVQGLTEFLPVSSSGHLALLQNILDIEQYTENALAFDVMLHLGTLAAVIFAFRKDILNLIKGFVGLVLDGFKVKNMPNRRMIIMLLIATVPLGIGALLEHAISSAMETPIIIGFALCVTALLLFFADKTSGGSKTAANAPYKSALFVGIMQLIAVFPGVSRSGATLCGGLFSGYKRNFAVTFAFLMSIPAVVGASVLELPDLIHEGMDSDMIVPCIVGFAVSALFGYLAIRTVQILTKNKSLKYFAIYCAGIGIITVLLSLI